MALVGLKKTTVLNGSRAGVNLSMACADGNHLSPPFRMIGAAMGRCVFPDDRLRLIRQSTSRQIFVTIFAKRG